jgi:predicted amidohydrolase YtcJ
MMRTAIALIALNLPAFTADLLLTNAHIVTMNPAQPAAEAVMISGGRITWVGSAADARRRYRTMTAVDLNGATVLPGIIDAHGHLFNLGQSLLRLNLKDVPTPEAVAERVRERARTAKPGEWIQGWGWDEGAWASHYPTHELLTRAAPDNPVVLTGLHTYAVWVNRKALEAAKINRDIPDPPNGKILRDAEGNPTGVLTDRAQPLVTHVVPPPTLEQRKEAIFAAAQECLRHGLTEVHDALVSADDIGAFRELLHENRLPVRVYAMLDGADRELVGKWIGQGPVVDGKDPRLTIRCVKIFADGALGSRGAALLQRFVV